MYAINLPVAEPPVPANVEAEQAVLGSILIDPDAVVEVAELLTADDFYAQKHGWIYQAILDLSAKNTKADFLTVTDFLAVGARVAVLQQAHEQVVPALLDGRFAIFFGPSGRGKTLLARIVQHSLILEHGMPAVWLNWRHTMREIKGTFNGHGREADVWQQTNAPVLILDDPDKSTTEWSVGYLYDLLDQRMALTGGGQGPVLLVLNQLPKEFGEQLARHGHLGLATTQRGLQRGRPVLLDFSALPVWDEPRFWAERETGLRRMHL